MDTGMYEALIRYQGLSQRPNSTMPFSGMNSSGNSDLFQQLLSNQMAGSPINMMQGGFQMMGGQSPFNRMQGDLLGDFPLEFMQGFSSIGNLAPSGLQMSDALQADSLSLPFMNQGMSPAYFQAQQQVMPTNTSVPSDYEEVIKKAAEHFGVEEDLIKKVIEVESNYQPDTVSHAGAQGLMQLMPGTAEMLGVTNAFDPEENIFGGTQYLKEMMNRYDGDLSLALAAYNAGPGNVDRYGGIPPFDETQNYVSRILG